MSDDEFLETLRKLVLENPESESIRLEYSKRLISQEPAELESALDQAEAVLRRNPDSSEARDIYLYCAERVEGSRSDAWLKLDALLREARERVPHTDELADHGEIDWDDLTQSLIREAPITLADVAGMEVAKQKIESTFLRAVRNPELSRKYGVSARGGLLLWGPPGCGKTFLARAIAGEIGAEFVSLGLDSVYTNTSSSIVRLHSIFERARKASPCVLFLDEVDALGRSRAISSSTSFTVAQLLAEMDGATTDNDGLYLIGATNRPWDVDSALRRPGRFDEDVLVLPPDQSARESIFRLHLRGRPLDVINWDPLSEATQEFSGADIGLICQRAVEAAMTQALAQDREIPVTTSMLLDALQKVRPSTTGWFDDVRNYIRYANDTGLYDELAAYLKSRKK